VPKKSKSAKSRRPQGGRSQALRKPKPLYRQKLPRGKSNLDGKSNFDFVQATPIITAPFELREDGSIAPADPLPAGEGIASPALAVVVSCKPELKMAFLPNEPK
jgi:hypothetical protein